MAVAGATASVKVSGTAVALLAQATTLLSSAGGFSIYQVTSATHRRLDPSVTPVVYDGATPVTPTAIDYLYGKFTIATPAGTVTADFSYLPVATLAEGRMFSGSLKMNMGDVTVFESGGVRRKLALLRDADFKVERLVLLDDIDPDTVGKKVETLFAAGTSLLLELGLGGSDLLRAWLKVVSIDYVAAVDGIVTVSLTLTSAPGATGATFAFGT